MARLKYYRTIAEKQVKFDHFTIDTKGDFDKMYATLLANKIEKKKNLIYRGVNDSKFKLYNSAQRHWIQKELSLWPPPDFHTFIQTEIDNAKTWQNNLLDKFYQSFGLSTAPELAVLSFLQHYGAPTPLLDWSYNLNCGLFFAIDGLKHNEGIDLDNYCSLYIIDKSANTNELINYADLHKKAKEDLERIKELHPEADSTDIDKKYKNITYSLIKGTLLVYISDTEKYAYQPSMYTNTNFNIINQEGLFIYNDDPTRPLEELFKGKDNVEEGDTFWLTKITCVDIHKNLVEHIRDLLTRQGIVKDFIYPQEEKLAWDSFIDYLK